MSIDRNGDKWYITEILNAGRVLSKGQITAPNATFGLQDNVPYSLFLHPKESTTDITAVISVRLQQDIDFGLMPFNVNCWTEGSVWTANITSELLAKYDIYWGAGQAVEGVL